MLLILCLSGPLRLWFYHDQTRYSSQMFVYSVDRPANRNSWEKTSTLTDQRECLDLLMNCYVVLDLFFSFFSLSLFLTLALSISLTIQEYLYRNVICCILARCLSEMMCDILVQYLSHDYLMTLRDFYLSCYKLQLCDIHYECF